ncbi:MAG: histidine--tRNA ligase [Chitinophagales bacterium]|nr:histidine--tRNA ligase [Bacteroidota bacterium]
MTINKPGIPSGTRDFGPVEVAKRNYIIEAIRKVYTLYGYQPIETPAMENLSTLTGKYGLEGDKLLFKILNSGDFLKDADAEILQEKSAQKLLPVIAEKGLRYDLTVPFARYVVMNKHLITFPFKRYQIQSVWRADRPQKGRYREFYQCDADVIGSKSLVLDAELVQIIQDVFSQLNVSVTIRLNNRKILDGISEYIGETEKNLFLTVAIDKLDKIGIEGVEKELSANGFNAAQIEKIISVIAIDGTTAEKISALEKIFTGEKGKEGLKELKELFSYIPPTKNSAIQIQFDLTLARGLSYYTGTIYEVIANDVKMGSILGGGRYDDLTGIFGLPDTSGVGISFGLDRIYDVLNELNLFPASALQGPDVLLIPMEDSAIKIAMQYAMELHANNIAAELYPETANKLGKKFKYAEAKNITYALLVGEKEIKENVVACKNLITGEQENYSIAQFIRLLQNGVADFIDLSE